MFASKKLVLFITKSKITVSDVTIGNNPTEKIIGQFDWTPYTLDNALLRIKIIIHDNIRILLSEDFVYVVHITLPPSTNVTKNLVRQKAQEFIPEDLNETVWDFKEIIKGTQSVINPKITIQVVAIVKPLFQQLSKSIIKTNLHVEAIEPLSYAFARFTKQQEKPFLFVYIDTEILLTLAQRETVIATERLDAINISDINQFIAFTKEKFLIEPKNIIFCGNTKNIDLKQYENSDFKVEIQNISPAISLSYKEDIKGKDEDVLNLSLLKILSTEFVKQVPFNTPNNLPNKTPPKQKHFPYIIIIAIGCIISIGLVGGLIVYKNISSKKPDASKASKSTLTTPSTLSKTPLATPTAEIDLSEFTITILNGTGKAGEATKIETLLTDNGFNVVKTDNAETFDYEKTEVRFKKNVPPEFILLLDKSLKTLYDFSIGTKLEEEYDSDILIIIGKNIKD